MRRFGFLFLMIFIELCSERIEAHPVLSNVAMFTESQIKSFFLKPKKTFKLKALVVLKSLWTCYKSEWKLATYHRLINPGTSLSNTLSNENVKRKK